MIFNSRLKALSLTINREVMTELTIDNKKYVLIPESSYQELQKQAALKWKPEKTFSIEEARAFSKKLIRKWAAGK